MKVRIGPWRNTPTTLSERLASWWYGDSRDVKIQIDPYDTWSAYVTLSLIIAPMLRQLKRTKHGSPVVDEEDAPASITDIHERWDYVIDEMIYAFEQIEIEAQGGMQWDEKFYSGVSDIVCVPFEKDGVTLYSHEHGPNHTYKCDQEALNAEHDRLRRGFMLFGKYYMALWD